MSLNNIRSFRLSIEIMPNFVKNIIPEMQSTRITPRTVSSLTEDQVFVFGSNLSGSHDGGAAHIAYEKFGAKWGEGVGLFGQAYGIPTMQGPVDTIKPYVDDFIRFALAHPELTFFVTRIGCGIAGFTDQEIAPLFKEATKIKNIYLPKSFWEILS